jgi:hypothetical protein
MKKKPPKRSAPARTGAAHSQSSTKIASNGTGATAAFNEGCEEVVLGALMQGRELLVTVDDFSSVHRPIFKAIKSQPRKRRNFISITNVLRESGELEKVGGAARITEIGSMPHEAEIVQDQLERVLDYSRKRRAAEIGERLQRGEITPEQAQEWLAKLKQQNADGGTREPRIRFFSPCSLRDFVPDNDIVLVGDCNIMRGEVFVIGGEPGVGKSIAATQLAVSGATGRDWFGLTVHRQFRTMIVQTENGRYRLRQEFAAIDCDGIENFIRVSEPPPFGLTLSNSEFQADIGAALNSFKPECVIFDPWNAAARDDKQRDYVETFDALRDLLPTGADKPALGIIAHTRKPQLNEKRTGGTA